MFKNLFICRVMQKPIQKTMFVTEYGWNVESSLLQNVLGSENSQYRYIALLEVNRKCSKKKYSIDFTWYSLC